MIVIGIDPGLTGALALLSHRGFQVCVDMPVMMRGAGTASVKNQVNGAGLAELLRSWIRDADRNEVHVYIELAQSMPAVRREKGGGIKITQGGASIFSTGHTAGVIEGVVAAMGLAHHLVPAAGWKKALKLSRDKEQSRAMASRLYPGAPITRMKDHNRAEAILLAHYGLNKQY